VVIVGLRPEEAQRLSELTTRLGNLTPAETDEWQRLQVAAIPAAIEPFYSLAAPSTVPLYAGPLIIPAPDSDVSEEVSGTVILELAPQPRVITRASLSRPLSVQHLLEGMPVPQLPAMSTLPGPPDRPSDTGNASWRGPAQGYLAGKASAAKTVTFYLLNFVPMHGTVVANGVDAWSGRVVADAGPWTVTIDAHPDLREIMASTRDRGGYVVTHTCRLERRDRRVFGCARADQLLTCLTWCLWFCRAAAPATILPVGFDSESRAIWSRWSAPHTDPFPDTHWQWFDEAYGAQQLSMLLPLFFERWSDPVWQTPLQRAIRYYGDAAVMGTLQRNIVLAQVALESLAFAHLVRSSQQLRASEFKHPVSQHIRQFLCDFHIPTTIPRTFYGLRAVSANSPWDGPAAIAWLRNDIVHAGSHHVHGRRWKLWFQGWQLALWYLELGLLAVVNYEGPYRNRLAGQPDRGAVDAVPWAAERGQGNLRV
jgi:hypothetical protein